MWAADMLAMGKVEVVWCDFGSKDLSEAEFSGQLLSLSLCILTAFPTW